MVQEARIDGGRRIKDSWTLLQQYLTNSLWFSKLKRQVLEFSHDKNVFNRKNNNKKQKNPTRQSPQVETVARRMGKTRIN